MCYVRRSIERILKCRLLQKMACTLFDILEILSVTIIYPTKVKYLTSKLSLLIKCELKYRLGQKQPYSGHCGNNFCPISNRFNILDTLLNNEELCKKLYG